MKGFLKKFIIGILTVFLIIMGYFLIGKPPQEKEIVWGVNFSQKHALNLGLDWKQTYSALLDSLGVKNIKLAAYWDLIEPIEDQYDFGDLDWQINEAAKRKAKIILVVGVKVPRWPECHKPGWARDQDLLDYIREVVSRYKDNKIISAWQVENEPFFRFGECLQTNKSLLKKEVDLVKLLDDKERPIIISDSGEFSFWFKAAKLGDVVGITMYEKTWFKEINRYIQYYLPPVFYWRKVQIVQKIFAKEVFVAELQAEPWCPDQIYNCSLGEQEKTMNLERFKKNIKFAKATGFDTFYLWGAEWWYWLKEKQNQPEIWNEAKTNIIWTLGGQRI